MSAEMTVAEAIYNSIRNRGIEHAFCVPGESYLAVMNSFYGSARPALIAARHEEGAGLMAEAYAKATGKTGVCMVTRGPGLTHLAIALHTAHQDSTPLVAIVGQVPTGVRYREGFQEMDILAFARPVSKWAVEIGRGDRAAEIMNKAFHVAASGRPGPVVVSLPEDVDRSLTTSISPRLVESFPPSPSPAGVAAALDLIRSARQPCIVAGGGVLRAKAVDRLVEFAESIAAPVYTGWRRFDAFPNNNPLYLGGLPFMPGDLLEPLLKADLIIALGTRLGEFTTKSYTWPGKEQRLLQVDLSAEEAGGGHAGADLALVADVGEFLEAINAQLRAALPSDALAERGKTVARWRARFEEKTTPREVRPGARQKGSVDPEGVYYELRRAVDENASITCDAGTFGGWLTRYYRWNRAGTFFAPTAGGMGYALPAAIGAKLARPDAPALAFAGDGGFSMTMSELETAVRLGLSSFVTLVFNNRSYGTIKRHQQREFPGREVVTILGDVNYAKVAEAMGAAGYRVMHDEEFPPVLKEALNAGRPAVIDIVMSSERLDPWENTRS